MLLIITNGDDGMVFSVLAVEGRDAGGTTIIITS